jgi:tRNA/tmRNA/rRNA uracil-C5-methylase (TrmA/RlmC/RlmD family)
VTFQPGDLVEVRCEGVAHGGWCVARPPGLPVVFVRHALPGERVVARVTEVTSHLARGDAVEILEASPDRVVPPCPSARPGGCGGCDWQHAARPAQRALKAAVVREQLSRLAGVDRAVTVEEMAADGDGLGWRSRVQFAVDDDGMAGLRAHRSHEVIDVGDCLIAHPGIRDLGITRRRWPGAGSVETAIAAPAPAGGHTGGAGAAAGGLASAIPAGAAPGDARPAGPAPGDPGSSPEREVIVVRAEPGRGRAAGPRKPGPAGRDGQARQGRGTPTGQPARLASDGQGGGRRGVDAGQTAKAATAGLAGQDLPGESVLTRSGRKLTPERGRPYLTQHAAGRQWRVSAGVFWQVHPAAADVLTAAVLAALEPKPGDGALDLYCGAGLFAGALAAAAGPDGAVTGIESDEAAVRDARHNLRDLPWARIRRGEVGPVLRRGGLPPARLAVADPPRSGLDRAVIGYLSAPASGTERFCYVSCDPATLARDIGLLLARGWSLEGLRAFDAFPMTHHVECVAWLARSPSPGPRQDG